MIAHEKKYKGGYQKMIILIIGALIGGFSGWLIVRKQKSIGLTIFYIILGLVIGTEIAVFTSILTTESVSHVSYIESKEIMVEDIHLEKRLKGTFFLIFGHMSEKLYYVYKLKENGTIQKIAASNVISVKRGEKEKIIEVFKEYKNIPQKYPLLTWKKWTSDNKKYIVVTFQ